MDPLACPGPRAARTLLAQLEVSARIVGARAADLVADTVWQARAADEYVAAASALAEDVMALGLSAGSLSDQVGAPLPGWWVP
ncbi:hypothetical protein [Microbacterium sediminicola]|uniref:hypothetical protein n=1 Tax=Microbacterium sediminicola TaxID=415210 RepID=UPI0031E1C6FA